jgi:predicted RNA-binding Zn ribbon-like protein
MATIQAAPGELELVRDFVNTNDFDEGTELLVTPAKLSEWLAQHGLGVEQTLRQPDLDRAIELREALRALLLANAGEPLDPTAVKTLNEVAGRVRLLVRFDDDGNSSLDSEKGGIECALGQILAIVHRSMSEGTWPRLKACREETCVWAFYDRSKNRSAHWCSMAVCGNRAKARKYRERHKTSPKRKTSPRRASEGA